MQAIKVGIRLWLSGNVNNDQWSKRNDQLCKPGSILPTFSENRRATFLVSGNRFVDIVVDRRFTAGTQDGVTRAVTRAHHPLSRRLRA